MPYSSVYETYCIQYPGRSPFSIQRYAPGSIRAVTRMELPTPGSPIETRSACTRWRPPPLFPSTVKVETQEFRSANLRSHQLLYHSTPRPTLASQIPRATSPPQHHYNVHRTPQATGRASPTSLSPPSPEDTAAQTSLSSTPVMMGLARRRPR